MSVQWDVSKVACHVFRACVGAVQLLNRRLSVVAAHGCKKQVASQGGSAAVASVPAAHLAVAMHG